MVQNGAVLQVVRKGREGSARPKQEQGDAVSVSEAGEAFGSGWCDDQGFMNLPLRDKPWPPGEHRFRPCPICGLPWRPWTGSFLPCHARCLFTESEKQAIREDRRPTVDLPEIYGVSPGIIRAIRFRRGDD